MVLKLLRRTMSTRRHRAGYHDVDADARTPQGSALEWSAEDKLALQRCLDELANPAVRWPRHSPELVHLLAVPPEEAHERFFNSMSMVSLIGILVFSAFLPIALEPLDASAAEDAVERVLSNVFNVLAATLAVLSAWTSVFTTYYALIIASSVTPRNIYRAISQAARYFVFWQIATWYTAIGMSCVLVCIGAWIRCDRWAAALTLALSVCTSLCCFRLGGAMLGSAWPTNGVQWLTYAEPSAAHRFEAPARRSCAVLHADALHNIRQHAPEAASAATDGGRHPWAATAAAADTDATGLEPKEAPPPARAAARADAQQPERDELERFIAAALQALPAARTSRLAAALTASALELSTLRAVAGAEHGGLALAHRAIERCVGAELLPGQTLALAAALARPRPRSSKLVISGG